MGFVLGPFFISIKYILVCAKRSVCARCLEALKIGIRSTLPLDDYKKSAKNKRKQLDTNKNT